MKVYPYPLQYRQKLNLELYGGQQVVKYVTLMDLEGVEIKKYPNHKKTDLINILPQPLSPGIYIVSIHGKDFRQKKKRLK